MARETDQIAQDYSAMLGGVSVITNVLDASNEFCNDMTNTEKQARILRSSGYLEFMVALEDWGSEDMGTINAAIKTAKAYDPSA